MSICYAASVFTWGGEFLQCDQDVDKHSSEHHSATFGVGEFCWPILENNTRIDMTKPSPERESLLRFLETGAGGDSEDSGEVRTTSSTGGQKGVKPQRLSLVPPEALLAVAEHYNAGAEKYDDHQWMKGYEWSKSYDAIGRHLLLFWAGEDIDPETRTPHLAAIVFHAMTLIHFMKYHRNFDDRPPRPAVEELRIEKEEGE